MPIANKKIQQWLCLVLLTLALFSRLSEGRIGTPHHKNYGVRYRDNAGRSATSSYQHRHQRKLMSGMESKENGSKKTSKEESKEEEGKEDKEEGKSKAKSPKGSKANSPKGSMAKTSEAKSKSEAKTSKTKSPKGSMSKTSEAKSKSEAKTSKAKSPKGSMAAKSAIAPTAFPSVSPSLQPSSSSAPSSSPAPSSAPSSSSSPSSAPSESPSSTSKSASKSMMGMSAKNSRTQAPSSAPLPTSGPTTPTTTSAPSSASSTNSPGVTPSPTTAGPAVTPQPTVPGATPAPTATSTSATETPVVTPSPTSGAPGTTLAPTSTSSTETPVVTASPTGGTPATTPAPTTASGTTGSPTSVAITTETPAATTAPTTETTDDTCVVEPSGLPGTSFPDCNDNPDVYTVTVDIQIQWPEDEFAACDSQQQDSCINTNIAAILNEAFPTTVPDWEGTADFGTFVFDFGEEVNNVDPFGRRKLSEGSGHSAPRRLQEGECPTRNVECTADYCRWGCIQVTTTDCGTSSVSNWANLAEVIRARLATLGFDCLGIAGQIDVILLVDEANTGTAARDGNVFHQRNGDDPNAILLGDSADDGDDTEDDAPTKTLPVRGELEFHFFDGSARQPAISEIAALLQETKAFFTDRLSSDTKFANAFVQFDLDDVTHRYYRDDANNKDIFEMDFIGNTQVTKSSKVKRQDITAAMASYDFKEFISSYVWESLPFERNQFYETKFVKFTSKDAKRAHGQS